MTETTLKLDCLEGTSYSVKVTRDPDRTYTVRVFRPATEVEVEVFHPGLGKTPQNAVEEVAARTLPEDATLAVLNRVVRAVIETQNPSIVGTYAATTTEEAN